MNGADILSTCRACLIVYSLDIGSVTDASWERIPAFDSLVSVGTFSKLGRQTRCLSDGNEPAKKHYTYHGDSSKGIAANGIEPRLGAIPSLYRDDEWLCIRKTVDMFHEISIS